MARKKDIVTELISVIKKEESKVVSEKKLSAANDLYNKLLKSGTIKKRGYTLRGIEDYRLFRNSITNFQK